MKKPTGREFRVAIDVWPTIDLEIRATTEGRTFSGYAAVFNSWSEDLGGFREQIQPGAFARSLKAPGNVKMFLNHNTDMLLASTRAGTLKLSEDDKGLLSEATLPDTTVGNDTAVLLARRDIDSMSFGFHIPQGGDEWPSDGERILRQIQLHEVSPVTGWPAYPATSAFVRHLAEMSGTDPDALEEALRVLVEPETKLTDEQRDLLVSAQTAARFERIRSYLV
jgi:hypothetical protein